MDLVEPGDPGWAAALRLVAEQQRAELDVHLPAWPVYGFPAWAARGWLVGWQRQNGTLLSVEIGYGTITDAEWLRVHTQGRADSTFEPLDWLLASLFADDGREYPVAGALPPATADELPAAPRGRPAEAVVEGVAVPAVVQRVEDYVAWRIATDDVVVTVVGRGAATLPELDRIEDLGPYRRRRDDRRPPMGSAVRSAEPPLTGPDDTEPLWAHRGLIAMTIANRAENLARVATHRPFGQLDPDWGRRWDAAIRRQQELREQDRPTARDAVGAMVNQIGFLQQNAVWWDDDRLRQRAVNEIIWVTASGEHNVSSAAAQRTWMVQEARRLDPADLVGLPAFRDTALKAWQDWADRA